MCEEMDMPTPCLKCGEIFDLHEGCRSNKWYPNNVICFDCSDKEDEEIELDDEIENLKRLIEDAEGAIDDFKQTIQIAKQRLKELGYDEKGE
jgi:hypothetical protein